MKTANLSPYLAFPSTNGAASPIPTRGDVADCIQERLERIFGVDSNGRLLEDPIHILSWRCDPSEITDALKLCRDTRNAHEVAGELAWSHPRLIESVIVRLDRMILTFCS